MGTQGFSPRTRRDSHLIRFGASSAAISLVGVRGAVPLEIEVAVRADRGKEARVNGASLRAAEQLRRGTATLVFTPDRLAVVKGGPAARRAYFDRALGRLAPSRAQLPADYAAALAQRSAALRRVVAGVSSHQALEPWTAKVASVGGELVEARCLVLALLRAGFSTRAEELGLPGATLAYEGSAPTETELTDSLARDLGRGTTGAGPHVHDVRIAAGSRDLRSFGSQGEQRLAVLALLLAEARLLAERTKTPPLLLLDDVLSELDEERRRVFAGQLSGVGQAVITATSREALPGEPSQVLRISPGRAETV